MNLTAHDPVRAVCGTLPSGEHCALPAGHHGEHRDMKIKFVPTDWQGETDGGPGRHD